MSKSLLCLIFIFSFFPVFTQNINFEPVIWLKADSLEVSQGFWHDISGNDRHAIPVQGNLSSDLSLMNFNKSLPVGEGAYLVIPNLALTKNRITTIVVYEVEDSIREQSLWAMQPVPGKRVGLTTKRILGEREAITYTDKNRLKPVINSLSQSWRSSGSADSADFFLGYIDSLEFHGKISECLIFEGHIPDTILLKYISYLAVKYGVTLYRTDYRNSAGTIIWNYTDHPEYSGSIAGIGKDSVFGLNQKQSYLLEQKIKVGLDRLQQTNEDHNGVIPESNFLVWGFDSASLEKYGEIYSVFGEELSVYGNGLLQATGNDASSLRTFMCVDGSEWENNPEDYLLLIDRTGTGNFSPAETDVYFPSHVDSLTIHFSDIYWDTDGNGTDRFGFAYMPLPPEAKSASKGGETVLEDLFSKIAKSGTADHRNVREKKNDHLVSPEAENQYLLYPNPNSGKFRLNVHYAAASDIIVRIFNPEGKIMQTMNGSPAQDHRFEGTVPVKGHYLIEIQGDQEKKTFKMIVQ